MKIDLNSDLGEGYGRWKMGDDEGMMEVISSANVACGYHGGDAVIMTRMAEVARDNGVALGAHFGLPDLLGFGRLPMDIPPAEMGKHALYQLGALDAIAKSVDYKVTHFSTHGALGAMSRKNVAYFDEFLSRFAKFDPTMCIATVARSRAQEMAQKYGFRTVNKVFADRAYDDEGQLVNRRIENSVLTDTGQIRDRITQFIETGTFTTITGKELSFDAQCIVVHSDTPGAVAIARIVREAVEAAGGVITPMTDIAS